MKIFLKDIPDSGLDLPLKASESWVKNLVQKNLGERSPRFDTLKANLHLTKFEEQVDLSGHFDITLSPQCDRCLEEFDFKYSVSLHMNLAPAENLDEKDEDENGEVELAPEDVEFGTYKNSQIDLELILGELILLDLPIQFICKENCKGLCPKCGTNLNKKQCPCGEEKLGDPRWAILRDFKKGKMGK